MARASKPVQSVADSDRRRIEVGELANDGAVLGIGNEEPHEADAVRTARR